MATAPETDWQSQFGIRDWEAPMFFTHKEDIDAAGPAVPQAHALRRAFDTMQLNGIVCFDRAPIIYFKEVPSVDWAEIRALRRQFWSQGLAPILVLIDPRDVHVLSSLAMPLTNQPGINRPESLVQTLNRVAQGAEIRQFVLSVESGDFFRTQARSFIRKQKVDRELLRNLQATRDDLEKCSNPPLTAPVLDALLCRLVFTCYLFDRSVIDRGYFESIGIKETEHLRDIVGREPKSEARNQLYRLFKELAEDLNGDLFSDDLDAEAGQVTDDHLTTLAQFFHAADVKSGQASLWPYDFSVIPIETISAIYEQFLKAADPEGKKKAGAFNTPRFLVEVILDFALEDRSNLLNCRFLDPACGSGIFLVGLFNRLAEEWKRAHPGATYDRLASGLLTILRQNLFGVDQSQPACRIAAFSLYLALLDQLSPPAIRELQRKKKFLPRLVLNAGEKAEDGSRTILCTDFFTDEMPIPGAFDFAVGNPPWKSEKSDETPSVQWCAERHLPMPDKQAAVGFVWKAPEHVSDDGTICFILPHGVLFNHGSTAIEFQKAWMNGYRIESVLNFADYQRFLFEDAENPALVVRYRNGGPGDRRRKIHYLTPKIDWSVAQAELISIYPQDQTWIELREVLRDLRKDEVPLVWKERFWGTPRDWKLLDRLRCFQMLGENVGPPKDRGKRWIVAQGFQEPGLSDKPEDRKELELPTRRLMEARMKYFKLFVLESDCDELSSTKVTVRTKSNTNTDVYYSPHVLLTDGFKVAYANFDVTFRQSVRAIRGPTEDADLLVFLAAYLNSALARYYLFHTSANLGVERAKVESADALRLPFPFPEDAPAGKAAADIVKRVGKLFQETVEQAHREMVDRGSLVKSCLGEMDDLILRYFDVDESERVLIEDTNNILVRSSRRKKASERVPTLQIINQAGRTKYTTVLCDTLNEWMAGGPYRVIATSHVGGTTGLGLVVLHQVKTANGLSAEAGQHGDIIAVLQRLLRSYRKDLGSVELLRGVKVFEGNSLYIVKPLSQRFWTRTTALNDADEIAAAILTRPATEKA